MNINNLTPFTGTIDNSARLKHMACIKAPLKTIFDGKPEHLQMHLSEFTRRMKNTGLLHEFKIRIGENPRPMEIDTDEWVDDHPM
jgi:hypothetical protein